MQTEIGNLEDERDQILEMDEIEQEIIDLLEKIGLDDSFEKINELAGYQAKPQWLKDKERREREHSLRNKLYNKYDGSQLYEGSLRSSRSAAGHYENQSMLSSLEKKKRRVENNKTKAEDLVEKCNEIMQEFTVFDDAEVAKQEREGNRQIEAIERVMDEIATSYDIKDKIELSDIERIQRDNRENDDENLKAKFDLDYIAGVNRDWLLKTRKRASKSVLSHLTKTDHLKFRRMLERSFQIEEGQGLN